MEDLRGKKKPDEKPPDIPAPVAKKQEESSGEASSSSGLSAPSSSPSSMSGPSVAFTTHIGLLKQAVQPLPVLNVEAEVKNFSGGGALPEAIVGAGGKLEGEQEKQTLKDTIAMFAYMDEHANALGGPIDAAMAALGDAEVEKETYMAEVNGLMVEKLGFPVWASQEDRGMVQLGVMKAPAWFRRGKAELLEKSNSALQASKLDLFLTHYVVNMETKSYSRRVYSLSVDVKRLEPIEGPPTGTPIPYTQAGYLYNIWDAEKGLPTGEVPPSKLVVGGVYYLTISKRGAYLVTIESNTGSHVTFSKVAEE